MITHKIIYPAEFVENLLFNAMEMATTFELNMFWHMSMMSIRRQSDTS